MNLPKRDELLFRPVFALPTASRIGFDESTFAARSSPLEPLPPLDDLLYVDDEENWRRAILQEEFASAVECPVEDMYAQEFVAAPSEA